MEFIGKVFGHLSALAVVFMVITAVHAKDAPSNFQEAICDVMEQQARTVAYAIDEIPEHKRHGTRYWRLKNSQRNLYIALWKTCGVDLRERDRTND